MKGVFAAAFLNRYGQNFHPFLNGSSFIWRVFWRVLSKGNSAMLLISTRQRASQKLWLGQASWIHHSVSEAPELWKPQLWCCWRRECSHGKHFGVFGAKPLALWEIPMHTYVLFDILVPICLKMDEAVVLLPGFELLRFRISLRQFTFPQSTLWYQWLRPQKALTKLIKRQNRTQQLSLVRTQAHTRCCLQGPELYEELN